tara:strand:+ start:1016 stop:1582 length:567 start_codon:yes stop_codon:yes gene_type:complete
MKFSVNYLYLFFLLSFIFSEECYEKWFNNNFFINNVYYKIHANINNSDSIKIYTKNNKEYRIDLIDKIIITDSLKTISYNRKTNQLYIEKRDDNLSDFIFSFINIKNLRSKIKKNDNNYIKIKNKSYGNIYVYFNDKCTFIDSIVIDRMKNKFNIKNISVNSIDDPSNIDSLFTLDIDEKEVFKYDLR